MWSNVNQSILFGSHQLSRPRVETENVQTFQRTSEICIQKHIHNTHHYSFINVLPLSLKVLFSLYFYQSDLSDNNKCYWHFPDFTHKPSHWLALPLMALWSTETAYHIITLSYCTVISHILALILFPCQESDEVCSLCDSLIFLFLLVLFFSLMFLLFFYETFSGNPCTKLHWEKIVIEILLELELIILLSSIFTESCWFLIPLSAYYCHTNLLSNADLIGTAGDSRGLSQPLLLGADSKSPLNLFQPINIWLSLFTEDQIYF